MEILVDLRKLDLADRLGTDLITVENLVRRLEDCLDEIEILKEKLQEAKEFKEPDEYDKWLELHTGE